LSTGREGLLCFKKKKGGVGGKRISAKDARGSFRKKKGGKDSAFEEREEGKRFV